MKNKKENISEYILYLWQIEDYLRAFPHQAATSQELQDLYQMMHQEGIVDGGHLRLACNALDELEELHHRLLEEDASYRAAVIRLTPSLVLLKSKTDRPTMSDVEACLVLLYQVMMLRLQHRPVSEPTAQVQQQAAALLRFLSKAYQCES